MTQQMHHDAGETDDVQMPLGVGGGEAAPAEEYSENKHRINGSSMVLGGAFVIALAVLYLLGLQNKPRQVSAEQIGRDAAVEHQIDVLLSDKTETSSLGVFVEQSNLLIDRLQKYFNERKNAIDIGANPFERETPRVVVVVPPATASPVVQAVQGDPEKARTLLEVNKEFNSLKLDLVMLGGPNPGALINKRMVMVGTKFKYLTVSAIEEGRVLLTYDDLTLELKNNNTQANPR